MCAQEEESKEVFDQIVGKIVSKTVVSVRFKKYYISTNIGRHVKADRGDVRFLQHEKAMRAS